jgi:diguanylate cyclase (GGDEF)-like protein
VLACLFLLVSIPFVVCLLVAAGDPQMAEAVDVRTAEVMRTTTLGVDVAWIAVAAAALALRRRAPKSRVLENATIQLFSISLGVAGHFMGLATTPFALAQLGALMVGLLLFHRGPVLLGAVTCTTLAVGAALSAHFGVLPYGPLFHRIPASHGKIATFYHLEMMAIVVVTVGLVLGIFLYVLGRLRDREKALERLSCTDPLTGLANRREFFAAFERELARADRHGATVAVAILDLDHFKAINDVHGHIVGDQALVMAARVVGEGLRRVDVLARYGGEEFVVLLPDTDAEGARAVAERCRERLAAMPLVSGGAAVTVTASFGVAATRGLGARAEDVLRAADEALYKAKREGRNRVEVAA